MAMAMRALRFRSSCLIPWGSATAGLQPRGSFASGMNETATPHAETSSSTRSGLTVKSDISTDISRTASRSYIPAPHAPDNKRPPDWRCAWVCRKVTHLLPLRRSGFGSYSDARGDMMVLTRDFKQRSGARVQRDARFVTRSLPRRSMHISRAKRRGQGHPTRFDQCDRGVRGAGRGGQQVQQEPTSDARAAR